MISLNLILIRKDELSSVPFGERPAIPATIGGRFFAERDGCGAVEVRVVRDALPRAAIPDSRSFLRALLDMRQP